MLKKIISTAVCAVLAAGMVCTAALAETIELTAAEGWNFKLYTPDKNTYNKSKTEIITSGEYLKSGNATMHMYVEASVSNLYVTANQNVTFENGKDYCLSGDIYTTSTSSYNYFTIQGTRLVNVSVLADNTANEWKSFNYTFTSSVSGAKSLQLQLGRAGDLYIDNLSLREVIYDTDGVTVTGYGDELITNGDFEAEYAKPDPVTSVEIMAKNAKNEIAVYSPPSSIRIYTEDETGALTDTGLAPALTYSAYGIYLFSHTGLTNGTEYKYVVKTYSDKGIESDGVSCTGVPDAEFANTYAFDGWTVKNNGDNYGAAYVENGIGMNGSAALRLVNNREYTANTYMNVQSKLSGLTAGSTYRITYYQKSDRHNTSGSTMRIKLQKSGISADGATYTNANSYTDAPLSDGWTQKTFFFIAKQTSDVMEFLLQRFADVVIDDVSVVEVDAETLKPVEGAAELAVNGSFESGYEHDISADIRYYAANSQGSKIGEIGALSDIDGVYGGNTLYAEAKVTNVGYDNGRDVIILLAVYKGGTLQNVQGIKASVEKTAAGKGETYYLTYPLDDMTDGEYSARMFVWNGEGLMSPVFNLGMGRIYEN